MGRGSSVRGGLGDEALRHTLTILLVTVKIPLFYLYFIPFKVYRLLNKNDFTDVTVFCNEFNYLSPIPVTSQNQNQGELKEKIELENVILIRLTRDTLRGQRPDTA